LSSDDQFQFIVSVEPEPRVVLISDFWLLISQRREAALVEPAGIEPATSSLQS
jgi:hypothetical protein